MRYQIQITVRLNNEKNLKNYVSSFELKDEVTVSEFKEEIKKSFNFLDIYKIEKEIFYLGNRELKNEDVIPKISGLHYLLKLDDKK
jgi:hypothetical protein